MRVDGTRRRPGASSSDRRKTAALLRTLGDLLVVAFAFTCAFACGRTKEPAGLACLAFAEPHSAISRCAAPSWHGMVQRGFHGGGPRLGWDDQESDLTPTQVGSSHFGLLWSSAPFDECGGYPGRMYASPVYADDILIRGGRFDGATASVVFAATGNGTVYALNAFSVSCITGSLPAGAILWKTQLVTPSVVPGLDGGVPLGVLSTPV